MDTSHLLCDFKIHFSSIYLYILMYEQKEKRRTICDIALNVAANYNTHPLRNVTFARAVAFLSLLKNSTSYAKDNDQNMRQMRSSASKRERIT